ncbi:hypothetical protein C8Q78DRAFT_249687 [Trametes maxima]|nr:hypothetical protein C8Q78DRAFT_249687 [Trametes maxima]
MIRCIGPRVRLETITSLSRTRARVCSEITALRSTLRLDVRVRGYCTGQIEQLQVLCLSAHTPYRVATPRRGCNHERGSVGPNPSCRTQRLKRRPLHALAFGRTTTKRYEPQLQDKAAAHSVRCLHITRCSPNPGHKASRAATPSPSPFVSCSVAGSRLCACIAPIVRSG